MREEVKNRREKRLEGSRKIAELALLVSLLVTLVVFFLLSSLIPFSKRVRTFLLPPSPVSSALHLLSFSSLPVSSCVLPIVYVALPKPERETRQQNNKRQCHDQCQCHSLTSVTTCVTNFRSCHKFAQDRVTVPVPLRCHCHCFIGLSSIGFASWHAHSHAHTFFLSSNCCFSSSCCCCCSICSF